MDIKINVRDLNKLNEKGIYCIINTKNNKVYIGSTTTSFQKRFLTHYWRLIKNNHENKYLQSAWNKNSDYFVFRVMLVTDNLSFEQRAFDLYKPFGKRGYNLNDIASKPPIIKDEEIIKRRTVTFTKTINMGIEYYKKVQNKTILLSEVPNKYLKIVNYYLNKVPWNKGVKGYFVNYPSNRKLTIEGATKRKESFKQLRKEIYVYKDDLLIKKYNDVEELINDEYLRQFVSLFRSKTGNILRKPNIYQSCRTNKPYKGLLFKYSPFE